MCAHMLYTCITQALYCHIIHIAYIIIMEKKMKNFQTMHNSLYIEAEVVMGMALNHGSPVLCDMHAQNSRMTLSPMPPML